jgi:hypothetical protein
MRIGVRARWGEAPIRGHLMNTGGNMPATSARRADPSPSRGPAAAVRRAVGSVSPIVTMWRDGLTIIALESREPNRSPDYLTFEQAQAAQGIEVEEAPVQTVPTVDAATGPMPVLLQTIRGPQSVRRSA